MSATVVVARHGETEWNVAGRYQGRRESDLTPLGLRQAEALADALAESSPSGVVTSPLRRCRATAAPLALRWNVEVAIDARLAEIAHGSWEGKDRAEVERTDSERLRAWRAAPQSVTFPGGESLAEVAARWERFALECADSVVVVTHDVVVRLAVLFATGRPLADLWQVRAVNGGYARFRIERGTWQLLDECVDAHLEGLRADLSRQAL